MTDRSQQLLSDVPLDRWHAHTATRRRPEPARGSSVTSPWQLWARPGPPKSAPHATVQWPGMTRYEQSMARYEQHTLSHPDAEFANAVGHGDHRPTPRSYASSHRPQGRTNCRSPRARPASDRSLVLALLGPVAMRVKAATPVVPGVVASVAGGDDAPSQL